MREFLDRYDVAGDSKHKLGVEFGYNRVKSRLIRRLFNKAQLYIF